MYICDISIGAMIGQSMATDRPAQEPSQVIW